MVSHQSVLDLDKSTYLICSENQLLRNVEMLSHSTPERCLKCKS